MVTLCDRVREVCPEFPEAPACVHWSLADPSAETAGLDDDTAYAAFVRPRAELDARIEFLVVAPCMAPSATDPSPEWKQGTT